MVKVLRRGARLPQLRLLLLNDALDLRATLLLRLINELIDLNFD